jgi:mono/diheme cytochrome c family protein
MRKQLGFAFIVAVGLAGCGDGVTGDPAKGKVLYNTAMLGTTTKQQGCSICHSIVAGQTGSGPSLAGFGTEAEKEWKEHGRSSAQDFVKWQITDPDTEIATGFVAGVMPKDYGTVLTPTELDDLSAYVLSLK